MTQMDVQWNNLIKELSVEGYVQDESEANTYYKNGDVAKTIYTIGRTFTFDGTEAAIMEGKKINIEKPIGEILWILQQQSNDLNLLRAKFGIKFWDDWEYKGTRTIGKAYGWMIRNKTRAVPINEVVEGAVSREKWKKIQERKKYIERRKNSLTGRIGSSIKKGLMKLSEKLSWFNVSFQETGVVYLSQVEYLIQGLITNPYSRRHVISIWDADAQSEASLPPCVWNSTWYVTPDNKLHVEVSARSSDLALGLPFNIIQYQTIQHMIAQATGLEVGGYRFHMGNPHIYDRHVEGVSKIVERGKDLSDNKPQLILNKEVENFFDFTPEDVTIENYDPEPHVQFDIAVHEKPTV